MTVRPFVTSPALTGIAIAYRNQAQTLIADEVLPRVPVPGRSFRWTEYPIAQGFSFPPTEVGRTGRVARVEFAGEERDSSTRDYGLEDAIPISDIDEARLAREQNRGNFDPENLAAESLSDLIMLDREVRVAGIVQNPANYAPTRRLTLGGTSQFSDYANSDPIGVFKTGLRSTLIYRPNIAVMGQLAWDALSSHPKIVAAINNNFQGQGIVTREAFARLFELKKVLVGEGYVNTARKGQNTLLNRVWGRSVQLLYVDPAPRLRGGVTWGFTAQAGSRVGGRYEDKDVGLEGGVVVRIGEMVKEVVAAPDVGFLIDNAVAAA